MGRAWHWQTVARAALCLPHPHARTRPLLLPGMVFTIEPMINLGRPEWKLLDDGWTVVTADGSLSAQFEHTVAITRNGAEILTLA